MWAKQPIAKQKKSNQLFTFQKTDYPQHFISA